MATLRQHKPTHHLFVLQAVTRADLNDLCGFGQLRLEVSITYGVRGCVGRSQRAEVREKSIE